jgi:hypothetical protein
MAYLIFLKDRNNIEGTIYAIAETQNDLDNLNIIKTDYKIIEISNDDFNLVRLNNKEVLKYNDNDEVTFNNLQYVFNESELKNHIENVKVKIKKFLDNNSNHPLLSRWNDYYNQLISLNLNSVTYPLNKSLEQYFNDLGQPSYNILQLP